MRAAAASITALDRSPAAKARSAAARYAGFWPASTGSIGTSGSAGNAASADRATGADGTGDGIPSAAEVVEKGLPEVNLPACSSCHGPGKRPGYPMLDGQKAEYMAARLRHWRGDPAVVDARKPNAPMPMIARRIPEHLIEPLARHFASRRPER